MGYENITELDLSNKGLDELPDLSKYTNLKKLNCQGNAIVRLDNLQPGLQILYCSYNNIVALDNLPPGLKELDCRNNPLIYNFKPTLENIRNYNSRLSLN